MLTSLTPCLAQDLQPIALPKPQTKGGKPLMQALEERRTTRSGFNAEKLPPQALSNLLWAAFGVNRPEGPMGKPGRTAPSAMDAQEIDIYVAMAEGLYVYEAVPNRLKPVLAGDLRAKTSRSAGGVQAPVVLIYVSDNAKMPLPQTERVTAFTNADAGFIGQNVYLFCASEGLAAHFQTPDQESLAKAMNLRPVQHVLYVQMVGYPLKK